MLCPFCLKEADKFPRIGASAVCSCPNLGCDGKIPLLYPLEYDKHPAVPFAIIGPRGHGKSAYIDALITHLETRIEWDGFGCGWIDQVGREESRERLTRLREYGEMPHATNEVFPKPQVIRLQSIPRVGGCQLVFFDTGGEVFRHIDRFRDAGRYVAACRVVVWLVSLSDLKHPLALADLLGVYREAVVAMDADPKEQTVIVALTKGDVLCDRSAQHTYHTIPQVARDFLLNDDLAPDRDAWTRLQVVSDALRDWLPKVGQRMLVNLLAANFKAVRYCVLSSLGSTPPPDPESGTPFEPAPRGVLAPLFWLWQDTLAGVVVEHRGRRDTYFGLADAVAAAPPGATVRLAPGTFTLDARLQITRPLRVVGAGAAKTTISSAVRRFAVGTMVEAGQEVAFSDVTIEHTGPESADVVAAFGGGVSLTDCVVRGGIVGEEAKDGKGCGVIACKTASAKLTRCVVRDNQGNGVLSSGAGSLAATDCEFRKNKQNGVHASAAEASLGDCRANENALNGVRVSGQCVADVRKCTAVKNEHSGLLADEDAEVTFFKNDCIENALDGIALKARAVASVTRNKCLQNKQSGVAIHSHVSGTVGSPDAAEDANDCSNNWVDGIEVSGDAAPTVARNTCRANKRAGIRYSETGNGHCLKNTCSGNARVGVEVAENANPVVSGNVAQGTTKGPGFRIAPSGFSGFQPNNESPDNASPDDVPPPPPPPPPPRGRWGR